MKNRSYSKFDYDPFSANETSGDIVYKILGIEPDETMHRAPSVILNKKTRKDHEVSAVGGEETTAAAEADLENLKHLLQQEDSRGQRKLTKMQHKMKKMKKKSQDLINKKIGSFKSKSFDQEGDDYSLHGSKSFSDISRYSPSVSLRSSAADIGANLIKKVKRTSKPKYTRSSSDGVGMAALLVRSTMMAAPSLDSIAENSPPQAKPLGAHMDHRHNKLNISVGDSIIDLKASDSNLSSTMSMSSATVSESEEDESEDDDISESDDVVMIDADTISMVVKSVLAKEEGQHGENEWIQPSHNEQNDSDSDGGNKKVKANSSAHEMVSFDKSIKTGAMHVLNPNDKKHKMETCIIENHDDTEELQRIIGSAAEGEDVDEENWIKPGSTADDDDTSEVVHTSFLHDIKENISEKLHHIHMPHLHHHPKSEIKDKHGLLETAMETMLMEQATMMGAKNAKIEERRNSSIDSFKKMLVAPFRRRSNDSDKVKKADKKVELKKTEPKKSESKSPEPQSPKHDPDFGLFDTAMKTMLIETGHIIESVGVHPETLDPHIVDAGQVSTENVPQIEDQSVAKSYSKFCDNLNTSHVLTDAVQSESQSSPTGNESPDMPIFVLTSYTASENATNDDAIGTDVTTPAVDRKNLLLDTCVDSVSVARNNSFSSVKRSPKLTKNSSFKTQRSHIDSSNPSINHNNKTLINSNTSGDLINKTNLTKLLAPDPTSTHRSHHELCAANSSLTSKLIPTSSKNEANGSNNGHTRAESIGSKTHTSPAKVPTSSSSYNTATTSAATTNLSTSKDKDGKDIKQTMCRRSSDSDLSVTPKGNNTTSSFRIAFFHI